MSDPGKALDPSSLARRRLAERMLARQGIRLPGPGAGGVSPDRDASPQSPSASTPEDRPHASAEEAALAETKRFYDGVTRQLDASMFGSSAFFLNLGYAPTGRPQRSAVELPPHAIDGNSIRLVLETIGGVDLAGRHVLDVGCGRGGTIVTLLRYFQIASGAGLDLSTNAVRFCGRRHRYPNARFTNGDSQRMPFVDNAFDAVTNIESSHTYPHVESFYAEVRRVLRPGGRFLYSDLFLSEDIRHASRTALGALGFDLEREDDITENVLRSCDEIAERRQLAFTHRNDTDTVNNFLAAPGSWVYDGMRSGTSSFWVYTWRSRPKP